MESSPVSFNPSLVRKRRSPVVFIIIVINIAVFALWYRDGEAQQQFMVNNFLVSWDWLLEGKYWVLGTAAFSHNMFLHIFVNMFVLHSFGRFLERILGSLRFLRFYLVAGVFSSFVHAFVSNYYLGKPELFALGASGAIAGLVLLFSLVFPKEKILILGIIPVPALFGALAFVVFDIWGLVQQSHGGGLPLGHGAHLGGAFVGACYYFLFIRPRR